MIRNAPLLDDGTPMPTRYWLVDRQIGPAVSRLEAAGGVRAAEREVDRDELLAAHARYAADRDADLPGDARRAASVRRRRRHPHGRQVPARALRLSPRRR